MSRYFFTPASDRGQESASDAIRRQLSAGWYSWGNNTAHVQDLRAGDHVCFYAARGVGIVAFAQVASSAEYSTLDQSFPWRFRVTGVHFIDPPRIIDEDLRTQLDAFEGRETAGRAATFFVRNTRSITQHDFNLLTAP